MNEKNVFLLDGIGAIVSALIHGLVLPLFIAYVGLPQNIHYIFLLF